jgi:hypothetical protein
MAEPDAYRCRHCGAEYDPIEFLGECNTDDTGFTEFRCSCGSTDYDELYECKYCGYMENAGSRKNKYLADYQICDDCLGACVNEYNSALDEIAQDYRGILEKIFDIKPINLKEEY